MNLEPIQFIAEQVEVRYDTPPPFEKTPPCPDGFTWREEDFRVVELLSERRDYQRRGRMKRNMSPGHAAAASIKGSWGVGRFFFRVCVEGGRVFEIYYDRESKNVDDRKGSWFLYQELG
ncbi:MAG: hypothetical protein ISR59_01225 [Anaerolineales bacterium]|uniref:DUF6504 domain-containing protein n=1 Tax=Candidatus Desulfolinea nitratireducens TaxID=2841698 RepID=A0A8J6NIU0_9CHLR|nr:hypothetical protein [Candidatus Desulfolinea nitratireducens]MBL6959700.1 hypothetical protein [Anaerolineales bacterium]